MNEYLEQDAKIDFFIVIFQNLAKINDFSSYGKNDDLPSLNQIDDIFKFFSKNDDFSKFGQN